MLKNLIKFIMTQWERFFCHIMSITAIPGSPYNLLHIKTVAYKGEPLTLNDNVTLTAGDYVLEFHISNIALAKGTVGGVKVASDLHIFPLIRSEIRLLGRIARDGDMDPRIKALGGITTHAAMVRRMGFTLYPMPAGTQRTHVRLWMLLLRWVFSAPRGKTPARSAPPRRLEQFWMSKQQFMEKYGG